jgi:hypothetical protein
MSKKEPIDPNQLDIFKESAKEQSISRRIKAEDDYYETRSAELQNCIKPLEEMPSRELSVEDRNDLVCYRNELRALEESHKSAIAAIKAGR